MDLRSLLRATAWIGIGVSAFALTLGALASESAGQTGQTNPAAQKSDPGKLSTKQQELVEQLISAGDFDSTAGSPQQALVDSLEHSTPTQIETRLAVVKRERLDALRDRIETIKMIVLQGRGDRITREDVFKAKADLAHAETEYDNTPTKRLAALKATVIAAAYAETKARIQCELGVGGKLEYLSATAWRTKAEEQLARELLDQRKP